MTNIRDDLFDHWIRAGSAYLGLDSPPGPLYPGYGPAEGGIDSLFLSPRKNVLTMKTKIRLDSILALAVLSGCAPMETVPETGRRRPALQYTEAQMNELGAQAYPDAIKDYKVITGTPEAKMVADVARRIATATGKDYEWEFKLLDAEKTINAFCLPGGKIAVFSGILPVAQGEQGLAVVISHEIAHATLQHGNERLSQPRAKRLIGRPLVFVTDIWGAIAPGTRAVVMDGLGLGALIGKLLPYNQDHENEADEVGLRYMKDAGFDINEAPKFWRRMAKAAPGGRSDSLSTHPDPERRAKRLEGLIKGMQ